MRGVTTGKVKDVWGYLISTHTPHARRDQPRQQKHSKTLKFQLTRLMRGVTQKGCTISAWLQFQLTRLMRGVTMQRQSSALGFLISTHTPHARRDQAEPRERQRRTISTHTPHARRDFKEEKQQIQRKKFQLTRLMRGVTNAIIGVSKETVISTHTPHARRDRIRRSHY